MSQSFEWRRMAAVKKQKQFWYWNEKLLLLNFKNIITILKILSMFFNSGHLLFSIYPVMNIQKKKYHHCTRHSSGWTQHIEIDSFPCRTVSSHIILTRSIYCWGDDINEMYTQSRPAHSRKFINGSIKLYMHSVLFIIDQSSPVLLAACGQSGRLGWSNFRISGSCLIKIWINSK